MEPPMHAKTAIAAVVIAASSASAQCYELDFNNSGNLDVMDVLYMFTMWGQDTPMGDVNGDGTIDGQDLGYLVAHTDIFGEVECLALPTQVKTVAVVNDVTSDDDIANGHREFDVLVELDAEDVLISVYGANVGCEAPPCWNPWFLSDTALAIGSAETNDGTVQSDPSFDSDAFNGGTGLGIDAGWWLFVSGETPAGLAGQYPGNMVRVATFSIPEEVTVEGSFGVYFRTGANALHTSEVEFTLNGEDCYADFNDDGNVNILDFVAFQTAFLAQDPAADCDEYGDFNIFDFVCFQGAFVAGCR
jgi:hypothetical protein